MIGETSISCRELRKRLGVDLPEDGEAVLWHGTRGIYAHAVLAREGSDYLFRIYDRSSGASEAVLDFSLPLDGRIITMAPESLDRLRQFTETVSGLEYVE